MGRRILLAGALSLLVIAAPSGTAAAAPGPAPRALIAFLPAQPAPRFPLLEDFAYRGMAVGLTSPTLGGYAKRQMVLDVSAGSRVSTRVYPRKLDRLDLAETRNGGGVLTQWPAAVKRAKDAPGDVVPGLLGQRVQNRGGHTAYAGVVGFEQLEAIAAADQAGHIDAVSLGTQGTLGARAVDLWSRAQLLAVRLPQDQLGLGALDDLLRARRPQDMVYVVRAPPSGRLKLLPTGIAANGYRGALTSSSTRRAGLVTASDVAPTILRHLDIHIPRQMQGEPITSRSGYSAKDVLDVGSRLNVVVSRRIPTLQYLVIFWVVLLVVLDRLRGKRGRREALRIGFLGAAWLPGLALLTAFLTPSQAGEVLILSLGSLALGAITDRLVRWPVAPAVPVAVVFALHAADLARGSPLIGASLAGPNPKVGARFFGIGNELEIVLSVGVLLGAGAALTLLPPRWAPRLFALVALVAAVVIGSGRLGADVGGVITLGAGGAAAAVSSLASRPSRRTLVIAVLAPIAAVAALIMLDVITGGGAHLTRSVLHAQSGGDILDTIRRRFEISLSGLDSGTTPISLGVAIVLLVWGFVRRDRLLAPLAEWDASRGRIFRAGMVGAWFATVIGALANDSGPVIVLIGTTALLLATGYVRSRPPSCSDSAPEATSGSPQPAVPAHP